MLHSPYVQTKLVNYLTYRIEQTTGVKMKIGGGDFRPVKSLVLNDVLVEDYRQDTLLYCKDLRVKIDSFQWTSQRFTVKDVTLKNAYFNLWIVRGEEKSVMNLDVLLNALRITAEEEQEGIAGGAEDVTVPWQADLKRIQIRDSRFVYRESEYEAVDYGINWTDVECLHVNADITDIDFSGGRVGMRVTGLGLEEKSGFVIDKMEATVSACDSNLLITDTKIYTARSFLDLRKLEYNWVPGRRDWRHFTTMMQQYYRLGESRVSFIDLAYFNGILRGIENTVGCKGVITNTVNRIEGHQLEFTLGESTRLTGEFKSFGLPDFRHTIFDINIREAQLNPKDLETVYLPWFSCQLSVPQPLHHWNKFDLTGNFKGTIDDFILLIDSRTTGFKGTAKLGYIPCASADSTDCSRISGEFNFPSLNFAKLSGTEVLGGGHISGTYDGILAEGRTALNVNGKLNTIQIGKGKLKNTDLFLTMDDEKINVLSSFDNDSIRGAVMLTCDVGKEVFFLSSKGKIEVNDLADFGWGITGGKEAVKTGFDFVFAKKKGGDSFGNYAFRNFTYAGEKGDFILDNVSIENRLNDGYYVTSLFSDIVDMQIEGHYMSIRPLEFTDKLVRSYLPAYKWQKYKNLNEEKADFRYSINIKDADRVLSAVYPDLKIAPGTKLYSDFGYKGKKIHLRIDSDSIRYKDFILQNSRIDLTGDEDCLRMLCTADQLEVSQDYRLYNVRNELVLKDNTVSDKLLWSNWGSETYSGELGMILRYEPIDKNKYRTVVHIQPGVIVLADKVWNVQEAEIIALDKEISIYDFRIGNGRQYLSIDGDLSENPQKTLSFRLNRFDLSELNRVLFDNRFHVFGLATGEVIVQDYYKDNLLYSDVHVQDWGINRDTLGTLRILSAWDADSSRMLIRAENQVGEEIPLRVKGYYRPDTDSLNVNINLSKIKLDRLGMYASDYFVASRGGISGKINLTGLMSHPDFSGYLFLDSVLLTMRDVNTSFFINDSIYVDKSSFIINDLAIKDVLGRSSLCSGYYRFWDDEYELNITSRNFLILNTDYSQNDSFYGKVFMSGFTNINNRNGFMALTVNARPESNSRLYLPLTSALTEENGNFLHFVSPNQQARKKVQVQTGTGGMQLNANLELNDNLEIQIVFDPTIGDILKARGSGDIKVTLDQDGTINMFGAYKISKGDYLFTLSNLLNKKFVLTQGGSIAWNGSPYDATVDINAVYNLKTSLYELLTATSSTVDKSTKVPVECVLNLSDNFANPLVKFDINFPTLDTQTKSYVQSLFSSQDEINKQMFSLLILNKFYTPDYMTTADIEERNAGYQAGVTTASELVSNQLSRWLSKISNNFDIGFSYRPGDNITTDEIELALSTQLLNDRVTLSANGNMDVGNAKNVTSNSTGSNNIAGDFDLDVKLNKQGTLKLKAYSHTDEKIIYNATETIQGVGISYQEAFDTFRELLHRYFSFLRKKK